MSNDCTISAVLYSPLCEKLQERKVLQPLLITHSTSLTPLRKNSGPGETLPVTPVTSGPDSFYLNTFGQLTYFTLQFQSFHHPGYHFPGRTQFTGYLLVTEVQHLIALEPAFFLEIIIKALVHPVKEQGVDGIQHFGIPQVVLLKK